MHYHHLWFSSPASCIAIRHNVPTPTRGPRARSPRVCRWRWRRPVGASRTRPLEVAAHDGQRTAHSAGGAHQRVGAKCQRIAIGEGLVDLVVQPLGQVVAEHGGAPQQRHNDLHGRVVGHGAASRPRSSNRPSDVGPRPKAVHPCGPADGIRITDVTVGLRGSC